MWINIKWQWRQNILSWLDLPSLPELFFKWHCHRGQIRLLNNVNTSHDVMYFYTTAHYTRVLMLNTNGVFLCLYSWVRIWWFQHTLYTFFFNTLLLLQTYSRIAISSSSSQSEQSPPKPQLKTCLKCDVKTNKIRGPDSNTMLGDR